MSFFGGVLFSFLFFLSFLLFFVKNLHLKSANMTIIKRYMHLLRLGIAAAGCQKDHGPYDEESPSELLDSCWLDWLSGG